MIREAATAELVTAIHAVARGNGYFSPVVAREIALALQGRRGPAAGAVPRPRLDALTVREREVLNGIVDGRTTKAVVAALSLSARTVENHRRSIIQKLGAQNAAELVRVAVRDGLVKP